MVSHCRERVAAIAFDFIECSNNRRIMMSQLSRLMPDIWHITVHVSRLMALASRISSAAFFVRTSRVSHCISRLTSHV